MKLIKMAYQIEITLNQNYFTYQSVSASHYSFYS